MVEPRTSTSSQVWVIRAGPRGRDAVAFERARVVGLAFPPVASVATMPKEEAISAIAEAIAQTGDAIIQRLTATEPASARARSLAAWLVRFVHEVHQGDFVITPDERSGDFIVGRVSGPYEIAEDPPVPGYPHFRRVTWERRIPRQDVPKSLLPAVGAPMAILLPGAQDQLRQLISTSAA